MLTKHAFKVYVVVFEYLIENVGPIFKKHFYVGLTTFYLCIKNKFLFLNVVLYTVLNKIIYGILFISSFGD